MLGTLRTSTINKFGNFGLKCISFLVTWRWLTDTESGFRAFRADKLFALNLTSRGYEIESELRSQYLLVYQSQHEEGGDFRRVEVEVKGLKARTIPGYYP